MSYLDSLRQAEPSSLSTTPLFDVTYRIPGGHGWNTHYRCTPWGTWWLVMTCLELERPYRVRFSESRARARGRVLLDLFSYRLSDRSGIGTEE